MNSVRRLRSNVARNLPETGYRLKNFYLSNSARLRFGVRPRPIPDVLENVARSMHGGSKKILLVYPPKASNVSTAYGEAISLALIHRKREAEMQGWKVEIVNLAKERNPRKALDGAVQRFGPQVIGFSTTSPSEAMAFSLAKGLVKSGLANNRLIIKGGPGTEHAFPFIDYSFGKRSPIDVFFLGDSDQSFRPFLAAVETGKFFHLLGVPGIGISGMPGVKPKGLEPDITKRSVPSAADVQAMGERPFPSLLLTKEKHRRGEASELFGRIQTMTNCAFGCGFCAVSSLSGAQTRMAPHEAARQVREMVRRGIRNFYFEDATFLTDTMRGGIGIFTKLKDQRGKVIPGQHFTGWTETFLGEMKKIRAEQKARGKTIRFGIQTRVDSLDKNIILELAEAGCTNVFLGVETLERDSLIGMHKGVAGGSYKEQQLKELFRTLLRAGINPTVSLIVGHYTGGMKNFEHTIEKMQEFGAQEIFMQAAAVYPGTGDWKHLRPQESRHVVLSYLSPGGIASGVSKRGTNPEDQMQYNKWDSRRALNAYYRVAANILGKGFVRVNPGHFLRKRIYNRYKEAFR
ncbi:MAG: radical SAM protein [Candidatus Diapherotrites archaeon]|nr:radical SAM protein [Candidatus Diapherotrites archaeon]